MFPQCSLGTRRKQASKGAALKGSCSADSHSDAELEGQIWSERWRSQDPSDPQNLRTAKKVKAVFVDVELVPDTEMLMGWCVGRS